MEKAKSLRQLPLKVLFLSFVFFGFVLTLLIILSFLQFIPFSWGFGWLLGALIGSLNYGLIILQANRLTLSIQHGLKPSAGPGYMMTRFIIFAIGLLIAVLVKYEDNELFNVFSVFLAYLVISGTIFVTGANFQSKIKAAK
jgi:hypothetical protein